MKDEDFIEVKEGLFIDKKSVFKRLREMGYSPPRKKKSWFSWIWRFDW